MEFEKLPALTRREEDEPGYEAESWKPNWKCYCCHDTGFVLDRLAFLVIDGYDSEKSKIPKVISKKEYTTFKKVKLMLRN